MAGHITIGIRRSDDREYWMCAFSRGLDYLCMNPDFQREGTSVDDLTDAAIKGDWKFSMMTSPYKKYDYGSLVVDFKEGIIFSRQGYCGINPFIMGQDGLSVLNAMHKAKDIKDILTSHPEDPMAVYISYDEAVKRLPYKSIHVIGCGPLRVDHNCQVSEAEGFRDVKKWAKDHGWKLKTEKF